MQDRITDAIDRLRAAGTSPGRWQAAQRIMADHGSDWLTLGSAPPDRPTTLSVLSTTPLALMQDYIGENLHHVDPWMRYSAQYPSDRDQP